MLLCYYGDLYKVLSFYFNTFELFYEIMYNSCENFSKYLLKLSVNRFEDSSIITENTDVYAINKKTDLLLCKVLRIYLV